MNINYKFQDKKSKIHPDFSDFQRQNWRNFEVTWKELSYTVPDAIFRRKTIFNRISGSFRNGQIMAILGPSGCGKSSLLGCLSGVKKRGVSGAVTISTEKKVKMRYIAQEDHLHDTLTVREALLYASELQNGIDIDHKTNVSDVMAKLNISDCSDIPSKQCSGGQRKRISIALELVSRPDILILDEPTSGLDSVTTWQLINTLKTLAQMSPPIAIVATIHQPSGPLFRLFDLCYFMSFNGQCIYRGRPKHLVDFLAQFGFKCPDFHNPSDFMLEIASKEHGLARPLLLAAVMKIEAMEVSPHEKSLQPFHTYRTCSQLWTLTKRTMTLTIRDIWMVPMRTIAHIVFALLTVSLWGAESGHLSGCAPDFLSANTSYFDNYKAVSEELTENLSCIVSVLMMVWFGSIFCVLLSYPKQMHTLLKEYQNGWYSIFSFYSAQVAVDVFFQLTIPNLVSVPSYLWTGQYIEEEWRFYYFIVICLLLALTSSSMGLIVSVLLMNYPTAAVFVGSNIGFVLYLFSGFLIPYNDMPKPFQWLSLVNFIQFGFRAGIVDVYGFDRCGQMMADNGTQQIIDFKITEKQIYKILTTDKFNGAALIALFSQLTGQTTEGKASVVMRQQEFSDNDLHFSIAMLVFITVTYKVITYFVLYKKVRSIQ